MRRKNSKSLFLLITLFIGFIVFLVLLLGSGEKREEQKPQTVQVLAAAENMDIGSVIEVGKMQWMDIPLAHMKDNYIPKQNAELMQKIDKSVVKKSITKDEIIDSNTLIDTHGRSALSAVIQDGMRAVTVPYNKLANAPSLIAPGDIIDIILPKRAEANKDDYFGETILQNIKVLAVDNSLKKTDTADSTVTSPKSISLEVSAEQAENLAASIRDGQVVVSMHSVFTKDIKPASIKKSTDLPTRPPESQVVDVFRGTEKSQVTFEIQGPAKKPDQK
jgi:pilus assembly protein CpaB